MTPTAEFLAKMVELSTAFASRTAIDADEFDALGMALAEGDNRGHRARLQYLAHRLAGGSATFGLVSLEAPASDLEAGILANADASQISALSLAMAQAIRQVCTEPAPFSERNDATP